MLIVAKDKGEIRKVKAQLRYEFDIVASKVDTQDNLANMITKSFHIVKFEHCWNLVGIYY